jgi:prolipoprotein diacylglyceryltransferase
MIINVINHYLDRIARSELRWRGYTIQPFRFFCITGFLMGLALAQLLALGQPKVSNAVIALMALVGIAVFYVYVMLTKIFTGKERLSNHYQQLLTLLIFTFVLQHFNQPILPHMDVVVLGMGVIFAVGRLGCLIVGCCHGVPTRCGVTYSSRHDRFLPELVGVRLIPVPLLESVSVLGIVLVGLMLLTTQQPGVVTIWYGYSYAGVRFILENLRGDTQRKYIGGLSVPQWLSLIIIAGITPLVFPLWAVFVVIFVELVVVVLLLRRKALTPQDLQDFAQAIVHSHALPDRIVVHTTSIGVMISMGAVNGRTQYTLSRPMKSLTIVQAQRLARLIAHLRYSGSQPELFLERLGMYHIIFSDMSTSVPSQ